MFKDGIHFRANEPKKYFAQYLTHLEHMVGRHISLSPASLLTTPVFVLGRGFLTFAKICPNYFENLQKRVGERLNKIF